MKLVTFQKKEVANLLEKNGRFCVSQEFVTSGNYDFFAPAYSWMIDKMNKRIKNRCQDSVFPIWCWRNELDDLYDIDYQEFFPKGTEVAKISLNVDSEDVLLSDYDGYHYVLNNSFLGETESAENIFNDKNIKIFEERFKSLNSKIVVHSVMHKIRAKAIKKSWDRCLDLDKLLWFHHGDKSKRHIQGTIWEIRKEQVEKIEILVSFGSYNF